MSPVAARLRYTLPSPRRRVQIIHQTVSFITLTSITMSLVLFHYAVMYLIMICYLYLFIENVSEIFYYCLYRNLICLNCGTFISCTLSSMCEAATFTGQ
jgi:hypothetical protein